jgi:hypothetical protein
VLGCSSEPPVVAVAERLAPEGRLDIFDLQQKMLDHTMRKRA